jgi:hypothetical protein
LNGTFVNRGEGPDNWKPNLAALLGRTQHSRQADRVTLRTDTASLDARIWAGKQLLDEQHFLQTQSDFRCENGFLVLTRNYGINRDAVLATERAAILLAMAADALVVKEQLATVGTMFLIPYAGSMSRWFRFQRVPEEQG